jgi:zinc transport system substrate-binding protein
MFRILTIFLLLCVSVLSACRQAPPEKPVVISSIKPVQALVVAVAGKHADALTLRQLLPDGASPHHYALKPSDLRTLESASAIFYIGNGLETFLSKPLANLSGNTQVVALVNAPNIQHLHARESHAHDSAEVKHAEAENTEDLHLWLNPANAIAMSHSIAETLSRIDPAHATDYATNAQNVAQRIQSTDDHIRQQLQNLQHQPYLSFHDAWQHFDTHFGLNFAGAVTLDVSRLPGARHVHEIRQIIEQNQAVCLLQEPQFPPALVKTLVEGSDIRIGEIDPLGMKLPMDENTYTTILRNAADSFQRCLRGEVKPNP